jgi:hypothetical protein
VKNVGAARVLVFAACLGAFALVPTAARADVGPKDWAAGPFPRATIRVELGAYLGNVSSTAVNSSGVDAGGQTELCLFCIITNDKRLALGDYQVLRIGKESAELLEGVQAGYAINDDVDVVGRVYYQWYGGRTGIGLGGAARWKRFTASVGLGPTNGTSFFANLRTVFADYWFVTAAFDTVRSDGAAPTTATSYRLAVGIAF